jgi:hypothetical protein
MHKAETNTHKAGMQKRKAEVCDPQAHIDLNAGMSGNNSQEANSALNLE